MWKQDLFKQKHMPAGKKWSPKRWLKQSWVSIQGQIKESVRLMISSVNKNPKYGTCWNDEHCSVIEYLQKSCAQQRNRLEAEHHPEKIVYKWDREIPLRNHALEHYDLSICRTVHSQLTNSANKRNCIWPTFNRCNYVSRQNGIF